LHIISNRENLECEK